MSELDQIDFEILKLLRDLTKLCVTRAEARAADAGHVRALQLILGSLNTELKGGKTTGE